MSKKREVVVHEFTSVSKHLDNDFVELLLREARKRGKFSFEKERCAQCETVAPKLNLP